MKHLVTKLILGLIGAPLYYYIEILYDNSSHWSMALLGSICFIVLDSINEIFPWTLAFWKQCTIGMFAITILEFITGCIVNLLLGWNIWHYTVMDLCGQVCIPFMIVWFVLAGVGIILADYLKYWFMNGEKPRYKFF